MRRLLPAILIVAALAAVLLAAPNHASAGAPQGASVAILDSGYTRHYASLNSWDFAAEFIDTTRLMSLLARVGIAAAIVGDHDVEVGALSGYKALIMPSVSCVSALESEKIQEFADAGGRVFSTYDTSLRDDFWRARPDFALWRIMGVRHSSLFGAEMASLAPASQAHPVFAGIGVQVRLPRVHGLVVKANVDTITLAAWADGSPAIVEGKYGVYCSENLFSQENLAAPGVATLVQNTVKYLVGQKYGAPFGAGHLDTRAAWYRPADTREEICTDFSRMAKANINTVFVDVFYDGQCIYPSVIAPQNPKYSGWDPLAFALEEGRRTGISVHAWLETLCVGQGAGTAGPDDPAPTSLLRLQPGWVALGSDGRAPAAAELNRYFLSAAHPEVQEFILAIVTELVTSHHLDGVHLDYLRYPAGRTSQYDFNPASAALMKQAIGFEPREVRFDTARWNAWFTWRCDNLTDFVGRISSLIRTASPGTSVSAAVHPYPDAQLARMQDWQSWVTRGYLDFVAVFTYTNDQDLLQTLIRAAQSFSNESTPVLAAIDAGAIPKKQAATELTALVEAARAAGATGLSISNLSAMGDDVLEALAAGPFRQASAPR
ncbi:MAG: family 10 glycosylhydrolase [Clostridia bacterium]|nr:family 10 glycosylhydrolase [Clostridia bacterium]